MKRIFSVLLVAVLMVGFGGNNSEAVSPESNQSPVETPPAKAAEVTKIDLDDPETLDKIIAEATEGNELQRRGKEGEELYYAQNEQTPYTGWHVIFHDNGKIKHLVQHKDGKWNGLWVTWHENGQKEDSTQYKDGKPDGLGTEWYPSGQKNVEANYKDGRQASEGKLFNSKGEEVETFAESEK